MNTKIDLAESDGPEIQRSEILNFIIKRCNEFIEDQDPKFPPVLRGLALGGLATDEELASRYTAILSSDDPPEKIIRNCLEIFKLALEGQPDDSPKLSEDSDGQDQVYDEKVHRRILMQAWHEGGIMLQSADFRWLRIFEILAWLGLLCDSERLAEFETFLRSFADDPKGLITAGREILKHVLFRRSTNEQSSSPQKSD